MFPGFFNPPIPIPTVGAPARGLRGVALNRSEFMSESHNFHYHIRWSGDTRVDWDCFTTAEEAKCCADQMVRWGEDYTVERFDEDCVRCEELRRSKHHTDAGS